MDAPVLESPEIHAEFCKYVKNMQSGNIKMSMSFIRF